MTFRNRLALFFVLIVVVPMLAVAFMLFRLIGEIERGKADAAISAQHVVAQQLFTEQRDRARTAIAGVIAGDRVFRSSLADGDRRRTAKRARQLVRFRGIARIVVVRDGRTIARAGRETAVAFAGRRVTSTTGRGLGRVVVSVTDARPFADRVRRITGLQVVVRDGATVLASTLPLLGARELPGNGGEITVGGRRYRVVSFDDRSGFRGRSVRISTLGAIDDAAGRIRAGRITAGVILLGFFLVAIACAVLVSRENVQLHETVVRESVTDELTGLSNRRGFEDALARELARSRRYGAPVGLVVLDIDRFKDVNDTYGHPQGDLVLREIARMLRETSRDIDDAARSGIGDELAVIMPETDLQGAFNVAERVRERVAALRVERLDGQGHIAVTVSCGVAAVPPADPDARALKQAADDALYEAKRAGGNSTAGA